MEYTQSAQQRQELRMTAELQQAIEILGMTTDELRLRIESEYLENPALEIAEGEYEPAPALRREAATEGADLRAGEESLYDVLLSQAGVAFCDAEELRIARFLVGCIDGSGYLSIALSDAAEALGVTDAAALSVLQRIQHFDPLGVGARDLKECLLLQTREKGASELVCRLIASHLEDLAQGRIPAIAKALGVTAKEVQEAADFLRTLSPRPGAAYGEGEPVGLIPDIRVQETPSGAAIELLSAGVPSLRLAEGAEARLPDAAAQAYMSERVRSARWLIQAIAQRQATLRRIVEAVLARQPELLRRGRSALRPMGMAEVAEAADVHESTVSRAVRGKYIEFPWGVLPLRSFFTAELVGGTSAAAAKEAIRRLVGEENAKKPLSDRTLTERLAEEGIKLSRRAVAKYREQLEIPAAAKRKRY